MAQEKRRAEKLFKLPDVMVDRALRDEQFLARLAKAQEASGGLEGPERGEGRQIRGGAHGIGSVFRRRGAAQAKRET